MACIKAKVHILQARLHSTAMARSPIVALECMCRDGGMQGLTWCVHVTIDVAIAIISVAERVLEH